MTCKDNCLHYEVCLTAFSSKGMYLGDDAEEMECFKNKADFVEVVRCKDCKHYRESKNFAGQVKMYCDKWSLDKLICTKPDDFCSYGERRDV